MRAFFAILIKDIRVRFSSRMELVFFIALPIAFIVVLSGASSGGPAKAPETALVLVDDHVRSRESLGFASRLGELHGITVRSVADPTELIQNADADLLLSIKPSDSPDPGPFAVSLRLSPWRSSAAATAERVGNWLHSADTTGVPGDENAAPAVSAPGAKEGPSSEETGNAGQIITWVLVPLLGLGSTFITERKRGTMGRILSTPASGRVVIAATVCAEMLAALAQIGLLVCFGTAVFHLPWLAHPLELAALSMGFCIAGAALGALLGVICRTRRQIASLGLATAMVLAVFGGCWSPSAFFPASLQSISRMDPARWAMDGLLSVLSPQASMAPVVMNAALLALFGVGVFLLSAAAARLRKVSLA